MLTIAIQNGNVIDVRTKKIHKQNIGIQDGKIAVISKEPLKAERIIDAQGLYVSPGFIDVHGHLDGYEYGGYLSASQGITSTIGGNCGCGLEDLETFLYEQDEKGYPIHQGMLVGHDTPLRRLAGACDPYRPATKEQIERMKELAREYLNMGAIGISFGLDYVPGCSIDEVTALAEVAKEYDRVCAIHTRLLTDGDLYSLYEICDVALKTGAHIVIAHFVYQYCNGLVTDGIKMLEKFRARGANIQIDSGMYTNWTTYMRTATFDYNTIQCNGWKWHQMIPGTGEHRGEKMTENLYYHMRKEHGEDSIVFFEGFEQEIYESLKLPYAMPSTDAGVYARGEGHPQIAGTYPRYLRKMVKELKLLSLEEAIYKTTLLPAEVFGIEHKGVLEAGFDGDITLIDMERIYDTATYPHLGAPDAVPEGIPYVLVNGVPVIDGGVCTRSKSGRTIRK